MYKFTYIQFVFILNFDSTILSSLLIIGLTQSDSENTKGNSSNMALAGQDLPLS